MIEKLSATSQSSRNRDPVMDQDLRQEHLTPCSTMQGVQDICRDWQSTQDLGEVCVPLESIQVGSTAQICRG